MNQIRTPKLFVVQRVPTSSNYNGVWERKKETPGRGPPLPLAGELSECYYTDSCPSLQAVSNQRP